MNQHPEILQRSGQTIAALVAGAAIVGLGTGTREAHETFLLVEHTTRALIERGFRVVALLDNQRVGELYDRYVRGEDVDLDATLAQAWGPWRTAEMRAALVWLRRFNEGRPDDPVRIVAVDSSRVLPADYDRVVELLTPLDATAAMRIRELLDVIRTAHDSGEHVQRARAPTPAHRSSSLPATPRTWPHSFRTAPHATTRCCCSTRWSSITRTPSAWGTTPRGRNVTRPAGSSNTSGAAVSASSSGRGAHTSRRIRAG